MIAEWGSGLNKPVFLNMKRIEIHQFAQKILLVMMAIVVSVALPACINENVVNDAEPWSLAEGDKCPDFQVTMNDGRVVTTSSL